MALKKRNFTKTNEKTRVSRRLLRRHSAAKGDTAKYEVLLKADSGNRDPNPNASLSTANTILSGNSPSMSVISPIYDFKLLSQLPRISNTLRQCIEAYRVNIESHGHTLEYIGPDGEKDSEESSAERASIDAFLHTISTEMSFREMREHKREDKECIGNSYLEVRRENSGRIVSMDHIPANTMRMTTKDSEPVEVEVLYRDLVSGEYKTNKVYRHFRRYVQLTPNGKQIFFKEFGDPRIISSKTGKVENKLSEDEAATEVYHDTIYHVGSAYGLPRWIGQLPSILGSRESELVNLNFFRENGIPAMAVLVSGGALTEDTFDRVEDYINAVKGQNAFNRIMVLEASADDAAGNIDQPQPAPKIDMKPMISDRQQDGLFQEYDDKCSAKVRSSFRLPPIFVGRAEDYTKATAIASLLMAEGQIFKPERNLFDDFMNSKVLVTYKPKYWRFRSLGPSMSDPESISTVIESFGAHGALTPNIVIKLANEILDTHINMIENEWGDIPFSIVKDALNRGATIPGLEDFVVEVSSSMDQTDDEFDEEADSNNVVPLKGVYGGMDAATMKSIVASAVKDIAKSINTKSDTEEPGV